MEERETDGTELSSYYRDRFGSHSPEEYKNLRLSHIDPRVRPSFPLPSCPGVKRVPVVEVGNGDLRAILEREFGRWGEHEVGGGEEGGG